MRIVEALKFHFSSPAWVNNTLVATVFLIIPIIGPIALQGWYAEIAQRLVRKHPEPIPPLAFSDLMPYLSRGIPAFFAQMAASLPIAILSTLMSFALVPIIFIMGNSEIGLIIFLLVLLLTTAIGVLVTMVLLNALLLRAELSEDLGQTFKLAELRRYVTSTFTSTLVATTLYVLLATPLAFVGMALCCVGIFPVATALNLGMVHLRVQLYEDYLARGGEPIPLRDPNAPVKPLF